MLPTRRSTLHEALQVVDQLRGAEGEIRLRAELLDGSRAEGELITLGEGHLSLGGGSGEMVYVPVDRIRGLYLAARRPGREFALVTGGIVGVTAVLVEAARVPFLRAHALGWIAGWGAIVALAGIVQLKRRTALGRWLTAWRPLFEDGRE